MKQINNVNLTFIRKKSNKNIYKEDTENHADLNTDATHTQSFYNDAIHAKLIPKCINKFIGWQSNLTVVQ